MCTRVIGYRSCVNRGLSAGTLWQLPEPATAGRSSAAAAAAAAPTSSTTASTTPHRSGADHVVAGVGEPARFASRVAGPKCPATLVADAAATASAAATSSVTTAGSSGELFDILLEITTGVRSFLF